VRESKVKEKENKKAKRNAKKLEKSKKDWISEKEVREVKKGVRSENKRTTKYEI
jgi:hypothetical protein